MNLEDCQVENEQTLRGSVLQVSARIEMILLRIVIISNVKDLDSAIITFNKKTLRDKLDYAINEFKTKRNDLYLEYEQAFNDLKKLIPFRNRFAHSMIYWDDNSDSSFKIIEISAYIDKSNKKHRVEFLPIIYTVSSFKQELDSLTNILEILVKLNFKVEAIIQQEAPHLYQSIT